jgi:hypothetical protein
MRQTPLTGQAFLDWAFGRAPPFHGSIRAISHIYRRSRRPFRIRVSAIRSGRCPASFTLRAKREIGVIRSAAYPLRLWPRSLQAQGTNHRAAANIAMHTKANSAVPRSAVRRSPRRLSVSLIKGLPGSSDDSINNSACGFVPSPPFQNLSSKPHAERARPVVNWLHFCLP